MRSLSMCPSLLAVGLGAYLFFSYSCYHSSSAHHSFGVNHIPISEVSYKNPTVINFHHQVDPLLCYNPSWFSSHHQMYCYAVCVY
ncbi:hypothetical protein IW262DRAFT_1343400 [Armillaria fumosa]|nr:hypothetical protein IW262DRAFT_1343400 [Armillaria fumosa]